MKRVFNVNFEEFMILTSVTIPPRPIARSMFWDDVIDKYYHQMTPDERERLFEWIQKNENFDLEIEGCALFHARFNPDNQYFITAIKDPFMVEVYETFKYKDKYHTKKNVFIDDDYITKIEKIDKDKK
jgi:hypothetical protein